MLIFRGVSYFYAIFTCFAGLPEVLLAGHPGDDVRPTGQTFEEAVSGCAGESGRATLRFDSLKAIEVIEYRTVDIH